MKGSRFFAVLAALIVSPAMAADGQTPQVPEPQYTITLQGMEWQQIAASIQRSDVLSARQASDLLAKISQQLQAQAKKPSK